MSGKITTLGNNCFATTQSVDTKVTENLAIEALVLLAKFSVT